jgi:hypothetical protein
MTRFAKIVVAFLCIVCVLALCIAPYADIPVTVLKALQIIALLLLTIAGAPVLANLFYLLQVRRIFMPIRQTMHPTLQLLPIEESCVARC